MHCMHEVKCNAPGGDGRQAHLLAAAGPPPLARQPATSSPALAYAHPCPSSPGAARSPPCAATRCSVSLKPRSWLTRATANGSRQTTGGVGGGAWWVAAGRMRREAHPQCSVACPHLPACPRACPPGPTSLRCSPFLTHPRCCSFLKLLKSGTDPSRYGGSLYLSHGGDATLTQQRYEASQVCGCRSFVSAATSRMHCPQHTGELG